MSSADHDDARLPARAESLLAEWPVPEKDEQDWEERAQAIQARLGESKANVPAELLRPPFPSAPGDEEPVSGRASSPKLTDIARAVRESRPDGLKDARPIRDSKPDKNLTEIAKESLSLASQARAVAPELAAKVRAAGRSPAEATPVPASTPSVAPPAAASRPPASAPAPASSVSRLTPLVAALGAGLALAAAVAVVVRSKSEAPAAFEAQSPAATAAVASAAPLPAPAVAPAEPGVNVDQLPGVVEESKVAARTPRASSKSGETDPNSKPGPIAAGGKPAPVPATESKAKPGASAAAEPELKPADGRTGLPEKPSTGAVQAALGAVIGGARSCVAGHERPSSATIVFGSDGRVQSVAVSGGADGTPAAGCIRAALEKARVHAFAKPTFSASVTIRPQ